MSGSVESGASLAPIVTVPVPVARSALLALLRVKKKLSCPSSSSSSVMWTATVLAVSPGSKVSVPPAAL